MMLFFAVWVVARCIRQIYVLSAKLNRQAQLWRLWAESTRLQANSCDNWVTELSGLAHGRMRLLAQFPVRLLGVVGVGYQ